jgi:hypothetical protein
MPAYCVGPAHSARRAFRAQQLGLDTDPRKLLDYRDNDAAAKARRARKAAKEAEAAQAESAAVSPVPVAPQAKS